MFGESLKFEKYIVGGAVRDICLGAQPKDIDFTTPLTKQQIIDYCTMNNIKYFVPSEEYETVCVFENDMIFEVTPYRKDILSTGRHTKHTYTLTLKEDLSRRDFTINAIALSNDGNNIDYFGGISDIQNKLIRTVGNPNERFMEDYLRIIRGIRFATNLGFSIDEYTFEAMKAHAYKIKDNVSVERVVSEVEKVFTCANNKPSIFFEYMKELGILKDYFPLLQRIIDEIGNKFPIPEFHTEGSTWEHIKKCLDNSPNNSELRWFCLTHDLGKLMTAVVHPEHPEYYRFVGHENYSELIVEFFSNLKVSKELVSNCIFIMENHMKVLHEVSYKTLKRLSYEYGFDNVRNLITFSLIDSSMNPNTRNGVTASKNYELLQQIIIDTGDNVHTIEPVVDGEFIMNKLNMKPSREVGMIKNMCYEYQLETGSMDKDNIFNNVKDKIFNPKREDK